MQLSQNATHDYLKCSVLKARHQRSVLVQYGGRTAQMLGVARSERVMHCTRMGLSDTAR